MMRKRIKEETKGILEGVSHLIDVALGCEGIGDHSPHHRNVESCDNLSGKRRDSVDAHAMIKQIYDRIDENHGRGKRRNVSKQLWRFSAHPDVDRRNKSPEVLLERMIVRRPSDLWPDSANWVNQVPVATGLRDHKSDGKRSIDLVHRCGDDAYEFIELKVESDTPLFAAMEILQYGLLYLFCRFNATIAENVDKNHEEKILKARKIYLRVLAPPTFYEGYDLGWLTNSLNAGLASFLLERKVELEMEFAFESIQLVLSRTPAQWSARPSPHEAA